MILLRPSQMCWICGKAVTPETAQRDEHDSSVHVRCHAARRALASARFGADRVPAAPARLQRIKPVAVHADNRVTALRRTGSD